MKKLITLILAGTIALSLAACTKNEDNSGSVINQDNSDSASNVGEMLAVKSVMGKVTSVAGNEVEINLAKEPEMPNKSDLSEVIKGDIDIEGEFETAIIMMPAAGIDATGGGGAAQRTDIELTGETKAFIIPAGMPVMDAMGNEKQLSDIKKGSLLNFMLDKEDNITQVFLYE